jgi:hypothetical protein
MRLKDNPGAPDPKRIVMVGATEPAGFAAEECAWQESNLRPCAPEAHALSPELQARRA